MTHTARLALLGALLGATASGQVAPAGAFVDNTAHVLFNDGDRDGTQASATVHSTVASVCIPALSAPSDVLVPPAGQAVWPVTLTTQSNSEQQVYLTVQSPFAARVVHDTNGNGAIDAADTELHGSVTLGASQGAALLIELKATPTTIAAPVTLTADCGERATITANSTVPQAALSLRKTLTQTGILKSGDTVSYTLELENTGQTPLTDLRAEDALDSELRFERADFGGTLSGTTVVWTGLTLAPGQKMQLHLDARIKDGTKDNADVRNTFQAMAPQLVKAATSNTVTATTFSSALLIDKTVSKQAVQVGDLITFSIRITNGSPTATLSDVTLEDRMPAGLTLQPGTSTLDGVPLQDPTGTPAVYRLGDFAPRQSRVLRYVTRVNAQSAGAITNVAVASGKLGLLGATLGVVASNVSNAQVLPVPPGELGRALITGRVYLDRDESGTFTAGDAALPGARILLAGGRSAVTDSFGRYHFEAVTPGTHALRLDPVAPGAPAPHPGDAGRPGSRLVNAFGLVNVDFPVKPLVGTAVVARQTTVRLGGVTLNKTVQGLRAVLILSSPDVTTVTVTDAGQRWTVTLTPGLPTVLTYDLAPSTPFTDPDLTSGDQP
ncbi:DUF7507 domain-containing protein [Deinococcus hohokamensis]|uniref:DUF11 domain-containing protein n=1 Tax=Deinococcus hohokamensis TaxID=309883 RepID=A0ABV9I6N3_9DEIO